ncbi:hypothetical protein PPMP20_29075 [Paraburkholderia phymatum]|uniref:Uncharacterized protein n=1 Tax=Paraburkholderia phymatum (strain DSM 17167 / CIP 108236 / LMG 21445 / STM815) TaxID=391038 RepID=B2JUX1_PARP8|nr:hypothetical protein [Paraburkholderia phymatum]ACC74749.1 hypothetical protein Bphy_5677 [Paraburkholderia phymatum STM815]
MQATLSGRLIAAEVGNMIVIELDRAPSGEAHPIRAYPRQFVIDPHGSPKAAG